MPAVDEDGWSEWIHPLPGYLMQCCDCGLIHEMQFEVRRIVERTGPLTHVSDLVEDADVIVMMRARRHQTNAEPNGGSSTALSAASQQVDAENVIQQEDDADER